MKKIMAAAVLMMLMTAGIVQAQTRTPKVDKRQANQQARLHQGVNSGELTKTEAVRLRAEQRHIRRAERRIKSDGKVTARERRKLKHKQNRASRDIRRQKHDGQERSDAN